MEIALLPRNGKILQQCKIIAPQAESGLVEGAGRPAEARVPEGQCSDPETLSLSQKAGREV